MNPAAFSPIGVKPGTMAALRPRPNADGQYVTMGRTEAKGTVFASILFDIIDARDANIKGLTAQMVLWPSSYQYSRFMKALATMIGYDTGQLVAHSAAERKELLEQSLAVNEYKARIGTDSFGKIAVSEVLEMRPRTDELVFPQQHPAHPVAPEHWPLTGRTAEDILPADTRHVTTQDELEQLLVDVQDLSPRLIGLDIECSFGPFGPPENWDVRDGAVRLVQIAVPAPNDVATPQLVAVIDLWTITDLRGLWKLLEDPQVEKLIHYAQFELTWLRWHRGLDIDCAIFDTSAAWTILEEHWRLADPEREPMSAKLGDVTERVLGMSISKTLGDSYWGNPHLDTQQLRYAAIDAAILLPIAVVQKQLIGRSMCAGQIECAFLARCLETKERTWKYEGTSVEESSALLREAQTVAQLGQAWWLAQALALPHRARVQFDERLASRLAQLETDLPSALQDAVQADLVQQMSSQAIQ